MLDISHSHVAADAALRSHFYELGEVFVVDISDVVQGTGCRVRMVCPKNSELSAEFAFEEASFGYLVRESIHQDNKCWFPLSRRDSNDLIWSLSAALKRMSGCENWHLENCISVCESDFY